MAKVNDVVRFLNSIGGGRIVRIEGEHGLCRRQ